LRGEGFSGIYNGVCIVLGSAVGSADCFLRAMNSYR